MESRRSVGVRGDKGDKLELRSLGESGSPPGDGLTGKGGGGVTSFTHNHATQIIIIIRKVNHTKNTHKDNNKD
jgi:hypothetical protein